MQLGSILEKFQTIIYSTTQRCNDTGPKQPILPCSYCRAPPEASKEKTMHKPINESIKSHPKMTGHTLEASNLTITIV